MISKSSLESRNRGTCPFYHLFLDSWIESTSACLSVLLDEMRHQIQDLIERGYLQDYVSQANQQNQPPPQQGNQAQPANNAPRGGQQQNPRANIIHVVHGKPSKQSRKGREPGIKHLTERNEIESRDFFRSSHSSY